MYTNEMNKLKSLYRQGTFAPDFYAKKIKDESVFEAYEKFIEIPFTYKDELRETAVFERTPAARDEVYGLFSSSGTTGKKTYYVYSKEDKKVHEEFVKTFYTELGIAPTDLGGVFAPIDTGVMAHTMMWQFTTMGAGYVNCPIPSPDNMAELISTLPITVVATRPDVVSAMAYSPEWTKTAQESQVKKMILGGGFMSKQRRKLLEKVWNADVYNMFGMSEMFGPMAGECRKKNGQHYRNDYLMIELIDPETRKPVKPGEPGIAVYTTLWNKGFPLLRYWTDDVMEIDDTPCECGMPYPRIYHKGRLGDCICINGKNIFPIMLEEITLKYGFLFDYQAELSADQKSVTVKVEKPQEMPACPRMEQEIRELFMVETAIEYLLPGELKYPGHGKRFFIQ